MTSIDGRLTVLVAPDKFKGSLTAAEVAGALALGLGTGRIRSVLLPLADGGDGSVAAAVSAGSESVESTVTGPTGHPVTTLLAVGSSTVVVEVATTSGMSVLPDGRKDALRASSRGVGEALRHGVELGARRIVVALGGSACTDGGAGMLAALGARFLAADGSEVDPAGGRLRSAVRLDVSGVVGLGGIELVGASDVTNPLTGPDGAAHVFAPQKGAGPAEILLLDEALSHLVDLAESAGMPRARASAVVAGAGSAGGIGYAVLLLGGRLVSGAGFFLDLLGFDERARTADLVVTGEGSLDAQTRSGKLVSVVAARSHGTPVVAAVGQSTLSPEEVHALGLTEVYALGDQTDRDTSLDPVLSAELLERVGRRIARAYAAEAHPGETAPIASAAVEPAGRVGT